MGESSHYLDSIVQEREAEAKHHEMEAARREAAEKAREYEGARAEVLCYLFLMPLPASMTLSRVHLSWLAGLTSAPLQPLHKGSMSRMPSAALRSHHCKRLVSMLLTACL